MPLLRHGLACQLSPSCLVACSSFRRSLTQLCPNFIALRSFQDLFTRTTATFSKVFQKMRGYRHDLLKETATVDSAAGLTAEPRKSNRYHHAAGGGLEVVVAADGRMQQRANASHWRLSAAHYSASLGRAMAPSSAAQRDGVMKCT